MTSECLVCSISDRRICIPVNAVQGILQLHCTTRVPCTESWVWGLGLKDNRVFTMVCPISNSNSNADSVDDSKMLLSRRRDADSDWGLRINKVLGMASITVDETRHDSDESWSCPGDWFRPAVTSAGDKVVWLDPDAVSGALARVRGGR